MDRVHVKRHIGPPKKRPSGGGFKHPAFGMSALPQGPAHNRPLRLRPGALRDGATRAHRPDGPRRPAAGFDSLAATVRVSNSGQRAGPRSRSVELTVFGALRSLVIRQALFGSS